MTILRAEKTDSGYEWEVEIAAGVMMTQRWGLTVPAGLDEEGYIEMQRRELKLLCESDPRVASASAAVEIAAKGESL